MRRVEIRSTRPWRPPKGILRILSEEELEGVIAHELAHVKHRDILISSIAATIGATIMMVSRFAMFFGGGRDNDRGVESHRAAGDDDSGARSPRC